MKKLSLMKSKKYATYVKKSFVMIKIKKSEYNLYHKVRDHCHYTRRFRGAAHNICNLRYNIPKKFQQYFIMVQHMIIIL